MGRILTGIAAVMISANVLGADYNYVIGGKGGLATLSGGDSTYFTTQTMFGGHVGLFLSDQWLMDIDLLVHTNQNDTTASSSFAFGSNDDHATAKWQELRIGLTFERWLLNPAHRLNFVLGGGGGLMVWSVKDPQADTTLETTGPHNETKDFAASELFLSGRAGINVMLTPKWSLDLRSQASFLTGGGAEFAQQVADSRDRWQFDVYLGLNFLFGKRSDKEAWKSAESWSTPTVVTARPDRDKNLDSDGDGIPDEIDQCPNTPRGAVVGSTGCSVDSDGDGVGDGLDDCPNTPRQAAHMVDVNGCPYDSDFDGVADYRDACPNNQVGAKVDSSGCPIDSDQDGVPDGLDDCPNTLVGITVDRFGCIDLSMFDKPMVFNIDYPSGSFEVDPYNREKLKELARVLIFVPEIKLEINGYTDNIGTEVANQALSEKRARRVRDYLVSMGVDADRIVTFGRGETDFVASNDTAIGRAQNRRIEIVFYK